MKFFKSLSLLTILIAFGLLANLTPSFGQVGAQVLTITPSQLDFGTMVIDSSIATGVDSRRMHFIIKNTSLAPIRPNFSRVTSPFNLHDRAFRNSDAMEPGEARTFAVSFDPNVVGSFTEIIIVTADRVIRRDGRFQTEPISGFSTIVTLTGRADRPGLGVDANVVDFGLADVLPDVPFDQLNFLSPHEVNIETITVTNTSNVPVRGVFKFESNVFFFADVLNSRGLLSFRDLKEHRRSFTLDPGEDIELELVFLPNDTGSFQTTATLEYNTTRVSKVLLNLQGSGSAGGISVSTDDVDFGDVELGDQTSQTIVFRNTGSDTLNVQVQSFCSEFSLRNTQNLSALRPGQTANIRVDLTSFRVGRLECLILVESNDPNNPVFSISLEADIFQETFSAGQPFVVNGIRMQSANGGFSWTAEGAGITAMQLQVFNLQGQMIYDSLKTPGQMLHWQGLDSSGQRLANGTYLYVTTTYGVNDEAQRSAVKKLAILR